jgi:PadR family transcriptional regulator PadR
MRGHSGESRERDHSNEPSRRIRGALKPWLLLLLQQKQSYGYELLERLSRSGQKPDTDSGFLYRNLRQLEEGGMVESLWDTEGQGPARRLYQVTPKGIEHLRLWAENLRLMRQRFDHFLAEYEKCFGIEEKSQDK